MKKTNKSEYEYILFPFIEAEEWDYLKRFWRANNKQVDYQEIERYVRGKSFELRSIKHLHIIVRTKGEALQIAGTEIKEFKDIKNYYVCLTYPQSHYFLYGYTEKLPWKSIYSWEGIGRNISDVFLYNMSPFLLNQAKKRFFQINSFDDPGYIPGPNTIKEGLMGPSSDDTIEAIFYREIL